MALTGLPSTVGGHKCIRRSSGLSCRKPAYRRLWTRHNLGMSRHHAANIWPLFEGLGYPAREVFSVVGFVAGGGSSARRSRA